MLGNNKSNATIDKEQLELLQNAQKRIKQKKRLYIHFVFFLIGSVFIIILNLVLGFGKTIKLFNTDWFVFAILAWMFLLLYHTFNVFITHKFMGKNWEQTQLEKLVSKQKKRLEELKKTLPDQENSNISEIKKKTDLKKNITIIAAVANNNAIGKDNQLIWHLSDDLKRFKALTSGHHIIMGRKTFESFPRPLPNRTHVVITRQADYKVPPEVMVVNTLENALDVSRHDNQPFIIGGGEIYNQALKFADTIELTRVHENFEADTFFPKLDVSVWQETASHYFKKDEHNNHDYSFISYKRI
ncbi:dihydrofolate reductase [Yeosuana sp. AK3]